MRLTYTESERAFRAEAADWLQSSLSGEFSDLRGLTSRVSAPKRRLEWEQRLGQARWSVVGWPAKFGGRDATLSERLIFAEEYAAAGGPPRLNHLGVELLGPTILTYGTDAQKSVFLPAISAGEAIWCQGYSEPSAGSDLSAIRTSAQLHGDQWSINGQKVWTSLAQFSDWAFILARTTPKSVGRHGLSFLLVPLDQPGVSIRPIRQITGDAEFNELFLDDARTAADNVLGKVGGGWEVAMSLLGIERGVSTLGQQMTFRNELDAVMAAARRNGTAKDPLIRQRLAQSEIGLRLMRFGALRMLGGASDNQTNAAITYKIQWASWRRSLGELAMDVLGQEAEIAPALPAGEYEMPMLTELFLSSRADTIYGGTNQIQRNLIAERGLGLPREPRGDLKG